MAIQDLYFYFSAMWVSGVSGLPGSLSCFNDLAFWEFEVRRALREARCGRGGGGGCKDPQSTTRLSFLNEKPKDLGNVSGMFCGPTTGGRCGLSVTLCLPVVFVVRPFRTQFHLWSP